MIRALDFLSIFFLLFPIIFAERSFYPRDSAERQSKTEVQVRPIVTPRSAQRYLWKYGWIEPVHWESRLFHGDPTPTVENVIQSDSSDLLSVKNTPFDSESLTDKELTLNPRFSGALRRFQEANELVVTGKLDAATMMAMNVLRCGVPDRKVPEGEESQPEDSEENGSTTPSIPNESEEDNRDPHEESTEEIQETGQTLGLPAKHHIRRKRSQLLKAGAKRTAFAKHTLKWRLLGEGYSAWLSKEQQRYILRLAFRMWSEVVPLNFEEDLFFPAHLIDVKLGFGTRRHLGCSQLFDDMGREFAHAWQLGDIHFNDDEHFVPPNSEHGISLLKVAVHEIGHVLGLSHMNLLGSVMQPNYIPANGKMELDWTDRMAIQKIYGKLYWRYDDQNDRAYRQDPEGHIYPRLISEGFPGISGPIDTVFFDQRDHNIYFFHKKNVTAFGVESQKVVPGYPKAIEDLFPAAKSGDHPKGNLDAVYFSFSHKAIFFIKGSYVWSVATSADLPYNSLLPRRLINEQWNDICDVHPSMLSMPRR